MKQSKTTTITLSVMVAVLVCGAITISLLNKQQEKRQLNTSDAAQALLTRATNSQYTDLAGNPANLDQYLGQVLVVTSWASWSPQSSSELRLLADAVEQYADDEVVMIAINRAESKAVAESYLQTININERIKLIVDSEDNYYQTIGGYTMPETLIYDRKGTIIAHKRGGLTPSEINIFIEQALSAE
jgi:thiol-disulfide isomerase/thioredoxin